MRTRGRWINKLGSSVFGPINGAVLSSAPGEASSPEFAAADGTIDVTIEGIALGAVGMIEFGSKRTRRKLSSVSKT